MTDKYLLKDLELLQELSNREGEAVAGGTDLVTTAKPVNKSALTSIANFGKLKPYGSCPACTSGFDPLVLQDKYNEVISSVTT